MLEAQRLRHQKIDEDPPHCAYGKCGKVIPKPRRYTHNVKYCSKTHADKASSARSEARKALKSAQDIDLVAGELYPDHKIRRGPLLEEIRHTLDERDYVDWLEQSLSDVAVARQIDSGPSAMAVGMARRAAHNDRIIAAANRAYTPADRHLRMLGPTDTDMAELLAKDPEKFDAMLDRMVEAFVEWRDEFFRVTVDGNYITRDFHRTWIKLTLRTIYTGGRQMILSPPRHGKTELLVHFCVWLIIRDPMIRILWVGPNDDVAQNSLGQVRNLLETHTDLIAAYLGPHQTFHPTKRGAGNMWQSARFTVKTRPQPRKQPTMWCTGVKGRIQSLDADFIVVDDPADPDDSATEAGRTNIERWFRVKLLSRKMHNTGLVMISSRNHPSDLYSNYIDSKNWAVQVDRAHDQGVCGKDLFDDHSGLADPDECVLFPEMNPIDYLRLQAEDVGQDLFDMMYLNQPRPEGTMIFDPDKIRANCLDRSRVLGTGGLPSPYRLVAGLDPAARGVQAAFLWAVRMPSFAPDFDPSDPRTRRAIPETYYMVDMETQAAGGMEGAVSIITEWYERYGCRLWVIEDTSFQKVFFDDPRIKKIEAHLDLDLRGHDTGASKHDKDFGVSATARHYHDGKVILPYGDHEAQRKVNALITQLTNFTGERPKKPGKTDILMASWFPFAEVIQKWRRADRRSRVRQTTTPSYPNYVSSETTLPWQPTQYPNMGN